MMEKTMFALRSVAKLILIWLYESNSNAEWINKSISTWVKNPAWNWFWTTSAKVAKFNEKAYVRIYNWI